MILRPRGDATAKSVTPDFYAELDAEFDGFAGCVLISQHLFAEAWSTWEMHPAGDEVVYLLSGDVDVVLWAEDGERTVRVSEPGAFVVVRAALGIRRGHTCRPRCCS